MRLHEHVADLAGVAAILVPPGQRQVAGLEQEQARPAAPLADAGEGCGPRLVPHREVVADGGADIDRQHDDEGAEEQRPQQSHHPATERAAPRPELQRALRESGEDG